ncbi:hypothetical protein N9V24_04970 [Pseudomonadota bacterium]|nr:hypothetical protein [Pseudomonadota bacterium]
MDDFLTLRQLIEDPDYHSTFDKKWHQQAFNKITEYLIKDSEPAFSFWDDETEWTQLDEKYREKNKDYEDKFVYDRDLSNLEENIEKDVKKRRILFGAATVCSLHLQDPLSSAQKDITNKLQQAFKRLSKKFVPDWSEENFINSPLGYYVRGILIFSSSEDSKKKFSFKMFRNYDVDSSFELLTKNDKKALLLLGRENLLNFLILRKQHYSYPEGTYRYHKTHQEDPFQVGTYWELPLNGELMYQLELCNKQTIFNYHKDYLKNFPGHSSSWGNKTFDLMRDPSIKEMTIELMMKHLKEDRYAVEEFFVNHISGAVDKDDYWISKRNPEKYTYFHPNELEPLTTELKRLLEYDFQNKPKSMFELSDFNENKTRFHVAIDIAYFANRIGKRWYEYESYQVMLRTIDKFLQKYFSNDYIIQSFISFLHSRIRQDRSPGEYGGWPQDALNIFTDYINKNKKINSIQDLEHLFHEMINFFGYKPLPRKSVDIKTLLDKCSDEG